MNPCARDRSCSWTRIAARDFLLAADENLHAVFYRHIMTAALEIAPSPAVQAIVDEVIDFQMPGAGITGFARKAAIIAKAGIYDLRGHRDDVLIPILRHWKIFELEGLNAAAEEARQRLQDHLDALDVSARKFDARVAEARVAESAERRVARAGG